MVESHHKNKLLKLESKLNKTGTLRMRERQHLHSRENGAQRKQTPESTVTAKQKSANIAQVKHNVNGAGRHTLSMEMGATG